MLTYPDIDPIAFGIGSWSVRWYGLTYLAGFAAFWLLGRYRAGRPDSGWRREEMDDLLFYAAIGVVLGGRLGYVLFYDFARLAADPVSLIRIWEGGMAFHGGLIGVLVAMWLYGRATERGFFQVTDFIAPLVPLGLGLGRIGNFINAELWGKTTALPWGMAFPNAGPLARHPSQLYQALLEGLALFAVLWLFSRKPRPTMAVSGVFLIGYGVFRGLVEFVRVPDQHIGYLAFDWLTMGQLLCVPMLIAGAALVYLASRECSPDPVALQPVVDYSPVRRRKQRRKRQK
ncbi:MAG: prolipoprotein diacylglyceryl transferase [Thiotrichales bacterium]|nr:prolipoprotein diacylglyceryl transferase [Thiotrichales bacterium]